MLVTGGCHCGYVTFEAEIDPDVVSICHCTDCQALTGSAFRVTVSTPADAITQTGNEPRLYRKIADNGKARLQYFCPKCGSPLFATGEGEDAAIWGIRWGSIRERQALKPRRQIWCRSAVPWIGDIAALPSRERE
jgi:hypothetical protein